MNNGQAAFRYHNRWRPGGFLPFLAAGFVLAFLALAGGSPASASAPASKTEFDPRRDGFSFANDTAREYLPDASGQIVSRSRVREPSFAHSCFLLCRSTIQFAKFARFAPDRPKLSDAEYHRLLKPLFRTPVWFPEKPEKIVIPGYRNLWEFSKGHKALLQATMGSWKLTYLRVGNWRMGFPFPRSGQSLAARRLILGIDRGDLQAVYLARFPKMNHCVVLYDYKPRPGGVVEFHAYDPNYPGKPTWLRYDPKTRSFELEDRWYFNGGRVNLMRVYLSPFH